MTPKISVIVPIYNSESYLDKCVKSIMAQTYTNLEIILVDDGSTDRSSLMCDGYAQVDSRIKVIHKKNGGLSSARNAGIGSCSGQYIGFVDSDDWISPTMYEELLSLCEKNIGTIATIGVNQVNEENLITLRRAFLDEVVSAIQLLEKILCHKDCGSVCFRLFPREIVGDTRFDESKLNEDVLFMVSMIEKVKSVTYTSKIGYYYFQRSGSTSRSFGKAVHDMVGNSKKIREYVDKEFSSLSKAAERFEIFQNMSFLLCCPSNLDRKSDPIYSDVLSFVRKHIIVGIRNPYLTNKEKMKLLGVALCPRIVSRLIEKKLKKVNCRDGE